MLRLRQKVELKSVILLWKQCSFHITPSMWKEKCQGPKQYLYQENNPDAAVIKWCCGLLHQNKLSTVGLLNILWKQQIPMEEEIYNASLQGLTAGLHDNRKTWDCDTSINNISCDKGTRSRRSGCTGCGRSEERGPSDRQIWILVRFLDSFMFIKSAHTDVAVETLWIDCT